MADAKEVAVVVGASGGLGEALVEACAVDGGMAVAALSRRPAPADRRQGVVRAYACDAADAAAVERTFQAVGTDLGPPDLVVFNVGAWRPGSVLDVHPDELEGAWRQGCLAGFVVAQVAARGMAARGRGTILFSGATAALRGSKGYVALAVPKAGLRMVAQSVARELGPKGVHVAHVVIDGQIGAAGGGLAPADIARAYLALYRQPRGAWTHELDLRAHDEGF